MAWEKGSFGVSGSIAGLTSDGKNLTNGLDYSSSIMDLASHNQQLSAAALSKEEVNEKAEIQQNDFKFQHSPVGFGGSLRQEEDEDDELTQDNKIHETSLAEQLVLSQGVVNNSQLMDSNLSEKQSYTQVSLKWSNKFGATSDS